MKRNLKFFSQGDLKPRHPLGAYIVKIHCYRLRRGRWRWRKRVSARAYDYSSWSRYEGRLWLPYTGSWRMRAYHADAAHSPSYSGWRYVTVK